MALSRRLRFEILRRDSHTCRYCGQRAPDVKLTVDHVVPVALGGSDDPTNLVAACADCNSGKSSIAPDAPLVAQVADDAIRWRDAMAAAAMQQAQDEGRIVDARLTVQDAWENWGWIDIAGVRRSFELPTSWPISVAQFVRAGMSSGQLRDLVDEVMYRDDVTDPWRYYCGCVWKVIRERQKLARDILDDEEITKRVRDAEREFGRQVYLLNGAHELFPAP